MDTVTETTAIAHRFTLAYDLELEHMLAGVCKTMGGQISRLDCTATLAAVLLGGGYGRGEGGVVERDGLKWPYNDMDFFVFTRNAGKGERERIDRMLGELAEEWHRQLHIEVDFAPARELSSLAAVAETTMFQELRYGHLAIYGDEQCFYDHLPEISAEAMPPREGLRLLLNRGTGLLLAMERVRHEDFSEASVDFCWRNLHKCALGCGDALLLALGRYRYSVRERGSMLEAIVQGDSEGAEVIGRCDLLRCYQRAVAFKTSPVMESAAGLEEAIRSLRGIWTAVFLYSLSVRSRRIVKSRAEAFAALSDDMLWNNRRMLKKFLLNCRYAPWRILLKHPFLTPQLWLLDETAEFLFASEQNTGYIPNSKGYEKKLDRYLRLWNRFN